MMTFKKLVAIAKAISVPKRKCAMPETATAAMGGMRMARPRMIAKKSPAREIAVFPS